MPPRAARKPSRALREQADRVVAGLAENYPRAECALHHQSPFQLLAATILSAQCTDARVNLVTPALFKRFPDAHHLAQASHAEVEDLIRSTGFFRAKAKNLIAMANQLVDRHDGQVPTSLDDLTRLSGVGRKTAHVVLGTAFAIPSGVVVDTHVKRLSRRLGLTRSTDPVKIEHDLASIVPSDQWIDLSHRLIHHGRATCLARSPRCDSCSLAPFCPRIGLKARRKPTSPPA